MRSRKELLVKMGISMPYEELESAVETCISQAATRGERTMTYLFPSNIIKEDKDLLYLTLANLGYIVNNVEHDRYEKLIVRW